MRYKLRNRFWGGGNTWYGGNGSDAFKNKFLGGSSSSGTNWSGLLGTGMGFIDDMFSEEKEMSDKNKSLMSMASSYGNNSFNGINDNSGFLAALQNNGPLSGVSSSDIRDKTIGQDISSALTTGLNVGMSTGNVWAGIGAAALDAGKSFYQRLRAQTYADRVNQYIKDKNIRLGKDAFMTGEGVDAHNDWMRMMSYYMNPYDYAFGGPLHSNGGDYNGGLTYIDEGGRHEENPYEGVPSGFDEEGNPNLVEEGEVIWNNEYVFSDRLKVPKELADKYKLGGKKDYTFAEAIEKLTKENTISPNDFITIATTKEIVNEFMDAQEALRQEEQIAAREELEAAQAQDFLAQLDAAQGIAPPTGAPVDMGQMSALPNEAPVTEGEMMPPGYAVGGEKRHRPGYEERREQGYSRLYEDELIELLNQYPLLNERRKAERAKADAQEKMEAYRSGEIGTTNNERVQGYINNLRRLRSAEKTLSEMPDDIMKLALGGSKFVGGGSKDDDYEVVKVGSRYYVKPKGSKKITGYTDKNGNIVVSREFRNLPSFTSASEAQKEIKRIKESAEPLEYSSGINASGIATYTGDKIIKRDTGEVDTKLNPIYEYIVADPNSDKVYRYHNYEDAARKYTSIPRKVDDPRIVGGIAHVLPNGEIHVDEREAKKALKAILHPQSVSTKETKSSTNRGIVTTAAAAEMPANFNAQLNTALGVQDTLGVPALQQPLTAQSVQYAHTAQTATVPSSGTQSSGSSTGKASGTTGRMTTPSGNTINYRRDINGKEWESAEPYQNFLSYMRGKGANDKEVKEWMDYIQSEIKNSGSRYELKNFDDWSRLAEDGKVGPVHQATLKAAEYFAKRRGLTAVNPNGGPNPTVAEVLGVKPESIAGAPQNPASGSAQTPSGNNTTQEPQFSYRDTRLRYAPPIGAAMDWLYRRFNRPDYSNADRIIEAAYRMGTPINIPVETIGDYRRRNPFDERYLVNMANQNRAAAARGIANTAGGNRSMDLLGNMSLAHSNQQELGEIMRQAYLANRQDDAQVADFNRGTNVYNMNAINQRNLSQAQLNTHRQQAGLSGLTQGYGLRQTIHDNWDDAAMESYNSLLASLGAIGKENEEYNLLQSMAEEGYFDHAYMDNGRIRFVPRTVTAKGGKLNRKKRRF